MEKKYELIESDEEGLFRIKALRDFGDVKKGDIGGYVESEDNLSHDGNCWIYNDAKVVDNAFIADNATVHDYAIVGKNAIVRENALVRNKVQIRGLAIIDGNSLIKGNAHILGNAKISGNAIIADYAVICDNASVCGGSLVYEYAHIYDNVSIIGESKIGGHARLIGSISIAGDIYNDSDYRVYKNDFSSGRYFVYTKSNKMWRVGCFYGTSWQLIKKAFKDSFRKGVKYTKYVILNKLL